MKTEERIKASELRQQGYSYNVIADLLEISKGTLSRWLRDHPLTKDAQKKLEEKCRLVSILNGKRMITIWEERRKKVWDEYNPPLADPTFMLGLGLYWGEGAKYGKSAVEITNTDASILRIFMRWIAKYFPGDYTNVIGQVHHYDANKVTSAEEYWCHALEMPQLTFNKTIIAQSKAGKGKRKTLEHGTLHLRVRGKGCWKIRCKIEKAMAHSSTG